jgi:thioredoxin 1
LNLNVGSKEFKTQVSHLDKTKPVMVYCLSGGRSTKAAEYMRKQGFTDVFELKGGMMDWRAKNKPVVGGKTGSGMTMNAYNQHVTQDKLVLVDFYAKWCAPCKKMAPALENLKNEHADVLNLLKVDADMNKELMANLKVQALPTLMLYKNGKLVWSFTGYVEKNEIEKIIAKEMSN